jgi:hypothetical protein
MKRVESMHCIPFDWALCFKIFNSSITKKKNIYLIDLNTIQGVLMPLAVAIFISYLAELTFFKFLLKFHAFQIQ